MPWTIAVKKKKKEKKTIIFRQLRMADKTKAKKKNPKMLRLSLGSMLLARHRKRSRSLPDYT